MAVQPKEADRILHEIDSEYEGRHTDTRFVRLLEEKATGRTADKAVGI